MYPRPPRLPPIPNPHLQSNANRSAALKIVIPTGPRISYYATPNTTTYAAFLKESRMSFASAANLNRKSGGAEGPAVLYAH
jgi:hypothetical protein